MPRRRLPPRLYLHPKEKVWVIRDGEQFMRLGLREDQRAQAEAELAVYVPAKSQRQIGLIYFVTAAHPDYPVKIGFTQSMGALRLRALQGGCPYRLYFLGHTQGSIAQERELHTKFDYARLEGEWFLRTPELLSYIEAHTHERQNSLKRP